MHSCNKNHLSLQKFPQNYRFPWVNIKIIKYTCRFNTLSVWCLIFWDISFHYFIYKFIKIIRNNCTKNKKEALICIDKSQVFSKVPNDDQTVWSWRRNFYGKCIKVCFHDQRFSVNCFCISFNSTYGKVSNFICDLLAASI